MAYNFSSIKVLIVEDNQPMLALTKSLLATFGVEKVLGAKDGDEAIGIIRKENPDIIITDWMMKPVDGISLTRRVRNDPRTPNPFVPIILMTGFSEKRRVFQARDAGVTEFLVKPFNARDLYRRLYQIIEKPRQFVRADNFFGPDRRRVTMTAYDGIDRRGSALADNISEGDYIKDYAATLQSATNKTKEQVYTKVYGESPSSEDE